MTGSSIRVVVADGSAIRRAELTSVLERDHEIEVVAEAVDGEHAVALARLFRPAVLLIDAEIPGLDGYEATRQIMVASPTRVIVISGRDEAHQVHIALQAARAGALTVVSRPSPAGGAAEARRMVTLVKALADMKVVRRRRSATGEHERAAAAESPAPTLRPRIEILGVAASTGGPDALMGFLGHLPAGLEIPVVVVQHIAVGFVEGMAAWLAGGTSLRVAVARQGEPLRVGHVYLAPDHRHLAVVGSRIDLASGPPNGGFTPSANVLFSSLARNYGAAAAGLVLSGMGQDGVAGAQDLRAAGGLVLAQDHSSAVFGMPHAVADAGIAHFVGPVDELAAHLAEAAAPRAVVA